MLQDSVEPSFPMLWELKHGSWLPANGREGGKKRDEERFVCPIKGHVEEDGRGIKPGNCAAEAWPKGWEFGSGLKSLWPRGPREGQRRK